MPRFDPSEARGGPLVRGFSDGQFVVDGARHASVLLTPERAVAWEPPGIGELAIEHLEAVLALQPAPEFILLGTGPALTHPPRGLVRALQEHGIGLEAMDSRAAARTWAVLRAEERWIAAALMPL
ncbi:MTH938/NDUFAF3 family protein [Sphingosinicella sp. YJ22]|uniref:Mth938-like domain-containing protein n=1 Tax=Sphingosinicella sp. YJ22 TaxID=1104780 RepID=UPI00140D46E2|nr:MTH938/NDUFAF3 family protein [Sphingosinicella sp. YJ22]